MVMSIPMTKENNCGFFGDSCLLVEQVLIPHRGDFAVLTKLKLGDFLISGITGGIITSYTITVKAKK